MWRINFFLNYAILQVKYSIYCGKLLLDVFFKIKIKIKYIKEVSQIYFINFL